jgi:hypothetical protein
MLNGGLQGFIPGLLVGFLPGLSQQQINDYLGGDLQPGCLADRLLTRLGQPQINL